MEPEVRTYLDSLSPERRELAMELRGVVLGADPSLGERINSWGYLAFGPGQGIFTIIFHAQHANLQVSNGADLAERFHELDGTGKRLRHLKIAYDRPLDRDLVGRLVRAALGA